MARPGRPSGADAVAGGVSRVESADTGERVGGKGCWMARDAAIEAERAARGELRRAVEALGEAQVAAGMRRRSRAPRWVALAAAVAVVAAVVSTVLWVRGADAYTDADYQRAAVDRVTMLLSPDHRRPEQVRRIIDGATGEFRDQFAQSADAYSRFVASQGTVARGIVDGSGVARRSGDRAVVLVASTVAFAEGDDPDAVGDPDPVDETVRRFRLRVLVEPADGELKLAAVQYLP